jgi:hypothetical protein
VPCAVDDPIPDATDSRPPDQHLTPIRQTRPFHGAPHHGVRSARSLPTVPRSVAQHHAQPIVVDPYRDAVLSRIACRLLCSLDDQPPLPIEDPPTVRAFAAPHGRTTTAVVSRIPRGGASAPNLDPISGVPAGTSLRASRGDLH